MPDNSIWYEECDNGWLELIPSVIDCQYEPDTYTPIKAVIHVPEQDLDDFREYPVCTIQVIDENFAFSRYDTRRGKIVSVNGNTAEVKDPSQPYFLTYQLNFFAKFKEDIDHITKQWRAFTGRAFSLPITLADGSKHKCNVDALGYKNQDDIDREVRRYIRSYVYRVWVDLEGSTKNAHIVTDIHNIHS